MPATPSGPQAMAASRIVASRRRSNGAFGYRVTTLPEGAALVVNGDDPQLGELAYSHPGTTVYGLDDSSVARPSLQHAGPLAAG